METLHPPGLSPRSFRPIKVNKRPFAQRALDLVVCFALFPLLCLVALVMAAVTTLRSPGPVIFRQRRIGFGGREFMLYKFRTMHVGADPTTHQKHFKVLVDSKAPMAKLDVFRDTRMMPGVSS